MNNSSDSQILERSSVVTYGPKVGGTSSSKQPANLEHDRKLTCRCRLSRCPVGPPPRESRVLRVSVSLPDTGTPYTVLTRSYLRVSCVPRPTPAPTPTTIPMRHRRCGARGARAGAGAGRRRADGHTTCVWLDVAQTHALSESAARAQSRYKVCLSYL
jgi:hypothetical protein